ncbi:response regulator transcription factor [Acidithiobacillus ferriphilus]|uniref:response regulator transcription factor n=1 Tax=Acidithiobacillus ferriphilus TaxID=1689834 RepID=UPI0024304DA5|nr:response regulator transcription factor [Acidithiobacillus ferriphilus]
MSARGSEADKVLALDSGADDYLTKPFTISELFARLRAHLRRRRPAGSSAESAHWHVGTLALDDLTHTLRKRGVPIPMTPKEYQLLHLFVINQGRVLSHRRVLSAVWGSTALIRPIM